MGVGMFVLMCFAIAFFCAAAIAFFAVQCGLYAKSYHIKRICRKLAKYSGIIAGVFLWALTCTSLGMYML